MTGKKTWLLISIILLLALGLRITAVISDNFDFDVYGLMLGVDKEYKQYILNGFIPAQTTHYWLSYRLTGNGLLSYRAIPAALQILSIIVLLVGVMKYWAKKPYMVAFSLLFIAYNSYALVVTSYSMISYSNDLLLGVLLFFFFLRIFSREINAKEVIWFSLMVFPLVVFSSIMIMVPLATGGFSIFLWRTYLLWKNKLPISQLKDFYRLWPLLSIPTVHSFIWWAVPFTNLGADKRPDMHWLFFGQSNFSSDLYGLLSFCLYNTGTLIRGVVKPEFAQLVFSGLALSWQYVAYAVFVGLIVFSVVYLFLQKKLDNNIKFTLIFLVVSYLAILVGGVLGMYPFGYVRYAGWFIGPVAVLIGYVFSKWFCGLESLVKISLFWVLVVLVTVSGLVFNIHYFKDKATEKEANYSAVEFVLNSKSEKILYSEYNQPVLAIRAPIAYKNGLSMGWGTFFGNGADGGSESREFKLLEDDFSKSNARTLTVIASSKSSFNELYPTWSVFIYQRYKLVREVNAPSMWVGEFKLEN